MSVSEDMMRMVLENAAREADCCDVHDLALDDVMNIIDPVADDEFHGVPLKVVDELHRYLEQLVLKAAAAGWRTRDRQCREDSAAAVKSESKGGRVPSGGVDDAVFYSLAKSPPQKVWAEAVEGFNADVQKAFIEWCRGVSS